MPDMRFAPPNPLRIADRATGLNSVSVRSYNERLVLSLLLQSKSTTRLEIGERTGLSAQTVSVLVRSLEHEGLVALGTAQKGRVGPPTVPIRLNPEGAYSVGLSVGARQTDVVLIDFVGAVRFHRTFANPTITPGSNHTQFLATIRKAVELLPEHERQRLAGVGMGLPHDVSHGQDEVAYFNALQQEIEEQLGIAVFVQNDITAAASGESMFGVGKPLTDYMFFYIGARLHGRLILNHQIHNGNSPVSFDVGIAALERKLASKGESVDTFWDRLGQRQEQGEISQTWQKRLVEEMSRSLAGVSQFIEFENVVLSSYAPHSICLDICKDLQLSCRGIKAVPSTLRPSPKAIGAASLPFSSRFMVK
jgi:predicted NBD/HSP70 family sugar kinase/predicted DNA-binding transcriptional regulator